MRGPSPRSLLRRVQKLEQARQAPMSPFAAMCGSFEAFEAECMADIAAGKLDRDFEGVLTALRRWEDDWAQWQREQPRWQRNGAWAR